MPGALPPWCSLIPGNPPIKVTHEDQQRDDLLRSDVLITHMLYLSDLTVDYRYSTPDPAPIAINDYIVIDELFLKFSKEISWHKYTKPHKCELEKLHRLIHDILQKVGNHHPLVSSPGYE
jgi:hypothetical protein